MSKAMQSSSNVYIGLMSGTSLDGVDGVLVELPTHADGRMRVLSTAHCAFEAELRTQGLALQQASDNELHREALFANAIVEVYADCVTQLRQSHPDLAIRAIGVHGQTIRHRPELAYTIQTNNPALLAERCGIDVIADFRRRDVAAGGQGAPLVPAFHRAIFGVPEQTRVVVNIGGISNISILAANGATYGFDTGPGNVLLDAWIEHHCGRTYDANGAWASTGRIDAALLDVLCDEDFFQLPPPKSTGRDLFDWSWLQRKLTQYAQSLQTSQNSQPAQLKPEDVQATLCALTAKTLAEQIHQHAPQCQAVFVCGGGAFNASLMEHLRQRLELSFASAEAPSLASTEALGVAPDQVEALAFAWLAQRFVERQPGNLADVTGAKGPRILGALYPA